MTKQTSIRRIDMAKREIPLFIIDHTRNHKRGECDFLVCTDKDNGFIAKADYLDGEIEEVGDDCRIGYPKRGVSCRIKIIEMIGKNSRPNEIRTLLKKGMDYFVKTIQKPIHVNAPTKEECATFLEMLIRMNKQALDDAGSDYDEHKVVENSLKMLQASVDFLREDR